MLIAVELEENPGVLLAKATFCEPQARTDLGALSQIGGAAGETTRTQ